MFLLLLAFSAKKCKKSFAFLHFDIEKRNVP